MSTKSHTSAEDEDPDATARLPLAQVESLPEQIDEATSDTDVFAVPAVPVGTTELAGRLREVERALEQQTQRVQQLEAELGDAGKREAALEGQLTQARQRQAALEAQLAESQATLAQQAQLALEGRAAASRHHDADLIQLRRISERRLEALTSWQGFRAVSDSLLAEAEARCALLESRVAGLGEPPRTRDDPGADGAVVTTGEPGNGTAAAELAALRSEVESLQSALAAAQQRQQELEDLAQDEATRARNLEAEIQASELILGDRPGKGPQRDTAETGNDLLTPAPQGDAPLRVLVLQGASGQVVYPIGRRTTIGRTPDNDIQIDASNVSRRHAVLLTSAEQCILEDLNSTNGVHVNGCRIARQQLSDGDIVTIGKTELRFEELS